MAGTSPAMTWRGGAFISFTEFDVCGRLVPVEEFDDAEFTKFRRRILLRLRRTLPELTIDGVYVSDFNLVVENT